MAWQLSFGKFRPPLYIYEVNVNFNEFSKILFEYDSDYYRFINNIEEEVIPTFTGIEDNNSYLD